jgi:hypothetical protein
MSPEQVAEIVKACRETGYLPNGSRACLLCGDQCPDEPMFVGVWFADEKKRQRRIGCSEERLANGGGRLLVYQVCQSCFERPTRNEDVDAEILKRMGVQ